VLILKLKYNIRELKKKHQRGELLYKQGVLSFSYELEPTESGMTALAGLPAYLELATVAGLPASLQHHFKRCHLKEQGWTDAQIIMSLILLNIAGGDCVDDLRILEQDEGLVKVIQRVGFTGHPRKERREQERRWRKERQRAFPSPPVVFRYLNNFVNSDEESQRAMGKAFIPAPNAALQTLGRVNPDLLSFAQKHSVQKEATLEMDASIVATTKQDAFYSYKGSQSYQPISVLWAEQDLVVYSELRDGNVPAAYQNLQVLEKSLAVLPDGVRKVYLRNDTAAYQQELLRYCAEGQNQRFGIIEFAIGADVTREFRQAVLEVEEKDWQLLKREKDGKLVETGQEWAEVCYVPAWTAVSKKGKDYRFIAVRELLPQQELPGIEVQLPFPTYYQGKKQYKLQGLVTNRDLAGDQLIWWSRERCGKGEEMHAIMKNDLAGGQFPSAHFGANAAWWQIMILAFNLNSLMKHLALPESWSTKRLKALRFGLINQAGRILLRSHQLFIRLSPINPVYALLIGIRQRLQALWVAAWAPNTA
jgi:hypothetical protein